MLTTLITQIENVYALLFVPRLPTLAAPVLSTAGVGDGVDGRALFAGRMGGMGGVGEAGPGLARIVVELHEAEDQVGGHQLKVVRRVGDHVPGQHKGSRELSRTR